MGDGGSSDGGESPVVPGEAAAAIKGVRAVDKAVDVVKGVGKATNVAKTIDRIEDTGQAIYGNFKLHHFILYP